MSKPNTDSWQYLVLGVDAQGEDAGSPSRAKLAAQVATALSKDELALHAARAGWHWEDVSGAEAVQRRRLPEGVAAFEVGTALMLVLTFVGGAAASGVIGNRVDAAVVSLMQVLRNHFGRKPPKLTRDTALVQARSAVIACFPAEVHNMMPELLYVMREYAHDDGSWEFGLRFHEVVGLGEYEPGPFLYVTKVLPSRERTVHTAVKKEAAN